MGSIQGFNYAIFQTFLGGVSAIDLPRLEIQNLEEAHNFLASYGYDLENEKDRETVWSFHRRAATFIRENLIVGTDEKIPDELVDPSKLGSLLNLLIFASSRVPEDYERQRWSCALLRVMHVYAHIENDLFVEFSDQIQEQVLKPFRDFINQDAVTGITLGRKEHLDQIQLKRFDIKPFKATSSSVIKLLTKPQAVSLTLLDKMGVRFVTRTIFDAFRVIRFLAEEHMISFPNVMPDQSKNTLYPTNLFFEVLAEIQSNMSEVEIEAALQKKLEDGEHRASFQPKRNDFSAEDYKIVKFISRRLIHLTAGEKKLHFFFPFEIQILDHETYLKNLSGDVAHAEYKRRQLAAARDRILLNPRS